MNILFIGRGYFSFKVCSDKNYFSDLLPLIQKKHDKVFVFSINDYKHSMSYQPFAQSSIPIYNIRRSFHFPKNKYHVKKNGNNHFYHHKHKLYKEVLEIFLTIYFNIKLLSQIVTQNNIQIINFMDNCGPAMRFVKYKFPACRVCYSAMNYYPRYYFYDSYLKFCLKTLDHVMPYTNALFEKFRSIALQKNKLTTIPWGVKIKNDNALHVRKNDIRNLYMQNPANILFLWTGFIQQIGQRDLSLTLDLAHQVAKKVDNAEFLFSFKPEFQEIAKNYSTRHPRVKILNKVNNFEDLLASSDFLLSPIEKIDSIVAPPLTWIESMNLGTPIITTAVRGASEIINNGNTGFIASGYMEIMQTILKLLKSRSYSSFKKIQGVIIPEKYNIINCAEKYSFLFNNLVKNNG